MYRTKWFTENMKLRLDHHIAKDDTIGSLSFINEIIEEFEKTLSSRHIVILLAIATKEQYGSPTDIRSIYKYIGEAMKMVDEFCNITDYLSEIELKNDLKYLTKLGFISKEKYHGA